MKALVYHGPGERSWEEVPDPHLAADTDVIVGVDAVTICGTDLHILKGDVPEVTPGTILGHEAVGTVEEVGSAVRSVRPGDHVLVSCISGCGTCRFCREGHYGQCTGGGGWALGHTINGVQAEYARVPFGDMSVYPLPQGVTDEAAVLLADILPTSYEVGVLNGGVQPGDTVVIVGAGPIGLAAVMTAKLYSPGCVIVIDPAEPRRDAAKSLGADVVLTSRPCGSRTSRSRRDWSTRAPPRGCCGCWQTAISIRHRSSPTGSGSVSSWRPMTSSAARLRRGPSRWCSTVADAARGMPRGTPPGPNCSRVGKGES
jgi:alcohol dehydrogenase